MKLEPTLCTLRGYHVLTGCGYGTSDATTNWSAFCSVCGQRASEMVRDNDG